MPKKIALLIHALHGGGAERLMSELAARWSVENEVHLITWSACDSDTYSVPSRVTRHGLDLVTSSRTAWQGVTANVTRVRQLRQKLAEINPHAMLSFCDQMNITSLQASRRMHFPRWIAEHSDPRKQKLSKAWEFWRSMTYPSCSGCIVLTDGIADGMAGWIPRDRLHVIPPAINASPPVMPGESRELSAAPSYKQIESNQILYVGRLSTEKRVDLLLSAWHRVYQSLDGWQLTIAGAGPEESKLQQQASGMERVVFTGWCDQPALLYRKAELFVLASDYEGFPVALLEALSHGLPCVATESSDALQELNRYGTAVLTVPTGNATALAHAILSLAEDIPLQKSMSQHACHISQHYSWQEIGKKWDDILRAMLA